MGDILSTKKNKTTNQVYQQQVTQQTGPGASAIGISGSNLGNNNTILAVSGDTEVALQALETAARGSDNMAITSLASQETAQLGLAVASQGFDVAKSATVASHQTFTNTLEYLQDSQESHNALLEKTITTAQEIALRATPVSPGSYGEIIAQQDSGMNKTLVYAGVALAVIVALAITLKK